MASADVMLFLPAGAMLFLPADACETEERSERVDLLQYRLRPPRAHYREEAGGFT